MMEMNLVNEITFLKDQLYSIRESIGAAQIALRSNDADVAQYFIDDAWGEIMDVERLMFNEDWKQREEL